MFRLLSGGGSNVQVQVSHGSLFRRGAHLGGDDAAGAVLEAHRGVDHSVGVNAADGSHSQKALVVDVGHHQANAVHVGGKHEPGATSLFAAHEIAHGVPGDLIHIGTGHLFDDLCHSPLGPRWAKGVAQGIECIDPFHVGFLLSAIPGNRL